MEPLDRRAYLAGVGGGFAALAGCLGQSSAPAEEATPERTATEQPTESPTSSEASRDGPPTVDRSLPEAYTTAEVLEASQSGGPAPDGIPAIGNPRFADAGDQPAFLDDGDPVFGVRIGGDARAYPQSVLVWHEIVNDVVGGESVSVTYCPLTGTAQGFYRGETTFGVSGQLANTNLIMFDRATESWWPQILARAITGDQEDEYLEEFQVVWTTWGRWRSAHPDTVVLTDDTGYARNYGDDPYGAYNPAQGYYSDESTLFPPLATDDRLHPKEVVIGVRSEDGALALKKETLRAERLIATAVGDGQHLAVYDAALDTGYVYSTAGEQVAVDADDDGTAVSWTDEGVDVDGDRYDADSLPFDRLIAFDAMWLAWYGYYPMTELYR